MMDGKALATEIRADVAREVAEVGHVGLATVLVGDDPASHVYISLKQKAAAEAGIDARDVRLPQGASEEEVLALVDSLNGDDSVDGVLVQLPLPGQLDEARVTRAVSPAKDVDGIHPVNAGNLYLGTPLHVPATPAGCMALLAAYDVDHRGAGLHHRRRDDPRDADGGDDDVRAAHLAGEVDGLRMAHGHGRVRLQEQHRDGSPDDLAAPDDHRFPCRGVDPIGG